MTNMKKFVTLALSFLFIFTLVGCTKKEEAKKEEATDTRNQSYTILIQDFMILI